jgi:predicted GNAT family acetyltransferase
MTAAASGEDEPLEVVVSDAPAASRYEVHVGDALALAGFADYVDRGDHVVFTHAEVFPQFGGRGIASKMARFALDDVIAQGKLIAPLCPFIVDFVRRNPSYVAHVDAMHRSLFPMGSTDS